MNEDSYVSGFKINYSTDTDSSNSRSNNSIITRIQKVEPDSKYSANPNEKKFIKCEQHQLGYFKRLKFSTSSLLKKINKRPEEKNNNSKWTQMKNNNLNSKNYITADGPPMEGEYNQSKITKPFDKLGISFRRSKNERNLKENSEKPDPVGRKDYDFFNTMNLSERCRVSIECKNNIISIEGHKVCSRK